MSLNSWDVRELVKSESGINISDPVPIFRIRYQYFRSGMAVLDETVFGFPTFEDKGRLQAHGNGIEIWLLPGQSLSREQERDCRLTENKSRPRHS